MVYDNFFIYEPLLSLVFVSVKSLNFSFKQSEYFELMNVLININIFIQNFQIALIKYILLCDYPIIIFIPTRV